MLALFDEIILDRPIETLSEGTRGYIVEIYEDAFEVELEGDSEATRAVPKNAVRKAA